MTGVTTSKQMPAVLGDKRRIESLDGLRAIALLAVMAFHARPALVPGGFFGVDLFFVLSGYFIARISVEQYLKSGSFSLGVFLERRLSRLLPAAVVVVAVCAWLVPRVASSGQLVNWNRDVVSSLTGWMNWNQIAAGNGYFARTVLPTPLLHFWSYAIELQFYFLWPMLFWGCVRAFDGRSGRGVVSKLL